MRTKINKLILVLFNCFEYIGASLNKLWKLHLRVRQHEIPIDYVNKTRHIICVRISKFQNKYHYAAMLRYVKQVFLYTLYKVQNSGMYDKIIC
jgi:hypothetical protein